MFTMEDEGDASDVRRERPERDLEASRPRHDAPDGRETSRLFVTDPNSVCQAPGTVRTNRQLIAPAYPDDGMRERPHHGMRDDGLVGVSRWFHAHRPIGPAYVRSEQLVK